MKLDTTIICLVCSVKTLMEVFIQNVRRQSSLRGTGIHSTMVALKSTLMHLRDILQVLLLWIFWERFAWCYSYSRGNSDSILVVECLAIWEAIMMTIKKKLL